MEREDFIKDWLEGKISQEDLDKKITENIPQNERGNLKKIIEKSSELRVTQKRSKEDAWKLLSEKIQKREKHERIIKMRIWIPLSIAASISLLVVSYFLFLKPQSIVAPAGTKMAYILPDGSEVLLNADSKIILQSFKPGEVRKVKLNGEAFFEVRNDGKFEVDCGHGTVTVLGTSFNVNQRNEHLEVACFSGSVQVTAKGGAPVILKAGESTRTTDGKLVPPIPFDNERTASWRQGDFYFDGVPLEKVLEELARQFNIEIEYTEKSGRVYTGYFNNKNLDEALQLVFEPMKLKYRREGNNIIVTLP